MSTSVAQQPGAQQKVRARARDERAEMPQRSAADFRTCPGLLTSLIAPFPARL
jgi:hypothetical protein